MTGWLGLCLWLLQLNVCSSCVVNSNARVITSSNTFPFCHLEMHPGCVNWKNFPVDIEEKLVTNNFFSDINWVQQNTERGAMHTQITSRDGKIFHSALLIESMVLLRLNYTISPFLQTWNTSFLFWIRVNSPGCGSAASPREIAQLYQMVCAVSRSCLGYPDTRCGKDSPDTSDRDTSQEIITQSDDSDGGRWWNDSFCSINKVEATSRFSVFLTVTVLQLPQLSLSGLITLHGWHSDSQLLQYHLLFPTGSCTPLHAGLSRNFCRNNFPSGPNYTGGTRWLCLSPNQLPSSRFCPR